MARSWHSSLYAALLLALPGCASGAETVPHPDPTRFEEAVAAFEKTDREAPPAPGGLVCLGGSSMRGWHSTIAHDLAPLPVIPRGFGGNTMNDALHFADRLHMNERGYTIWTETVRASLLDPSAAEQSAFLDTLEERTFRFFWDLSDPRTGLTPDRAPTESFMSVAAVGFALTAYPIGAERGYIDRAAAASRVLTTLEFLWDAPQDSTESGATGFHGFFYHFLRPDTGTRFGNVELSTVDTALLLGGALFCQSYFDRNNADEQRIRALADSLYFRVDWRWAQVRPPTIVLGWKPEEGFLPYDWRGYNEAMLVYLLALASPTYPVDADAWDAWIEGYRWGEFHGEEHVGFGPLFGHQYTHIWIDFLGIQDEYMSERGIDYFENSRRAVRAQHAYALDNPAGWGGYGPSGWGLTACDGPVSAEIDIGGTGRSFQTYWARGASFTEVRDDGTLSPTAVAGSIAFEPGLVIPTLLAMRRAYGDRLFGEYGFLDSFNPTFRVDVPVQHGAVDPELGWFDTDYLGIDQGPIVAMIENYRSGLVWETMKRNPHIVRGLRAARFRGGWLDAKDSDR